MNVCALTTPEYTHLPPISDHIVTCHPCPAHSPPIFDQHPHLPSLHSTLTSDPNTAHSHLPSLHSTPSPPIPTQHTLTSHPCTAHPHLPSLHSTPSPPIPAQHTLTSHPYTAHPHLPSLHSIPSPLIPTQHTLTCHLCSSSWPLLVLSDHALMGSLPRHWAEGCLEVQGIPLCPSSLPSHHPRWKSFQHPPHHHRHGHCQRRQPGRRTAGNTTDVTNNQVTNYYSHV